MDNHKIGIIGYGKMGQTRHQALIELGAGEIIAISDPFSSALPENIKTVSHDDIIKHDEIDIVIDFEYQR